jgi:hypothetical protein
MERDDVTEDDEHTKRYTLLGVSDTLKETTYVLPFSNFSLVSHLLFQWKNEE